MNQDKRMYLTLSFFLAVVASSAFTAFGMERWPSEKPTSEFTQGVGITVSFIVMIAAVVLFSIILGKDD